MRDAARRKDFLPEATDLKGTFASASPAFREYQDRLRCIFLRSQGWEKQQIAEVSETGRGTGRILVDV